ncbi:MAG: XrtN system VIT domain-containing protein [Bacteroidota bacterium]
MKTIFLKAIEDRDYLLGLILYFFSLAIFIGTDQHLFPNNTFYEGSFFPINLLFWTYLLFVINASKATTGRWMRFPHLSHNILLFLMANISAYSLNRSIPIFHESAEWLSWFLGVLNVVLLLFSMRPQYESRPLNYLIVFVLSGAWLFGLYQSIYIGPVYLVGIFAFWFFGVSLHVFVPLWLMILSSIILMRFLRASNAYRYVLIAGLSLPIGLIALFCIRWHHFNEEINLAYSDRESLFVEPELPNWVMVSQNIDLDWISRRALTTGIIYPVTPLGGGSWLPGNISIRDKKLHDPLVVTASFFSGTINLSIEEKLQLLESLYNERHNTKRRLWSGNQLSTQSIETTVQLFPDYRMAYTEKEFVIKHSGQRWRRQQEALYTFYLPEGAVASSASLWIEGEESPGYLTTRSKADSAYRTIVGVERRDPMLVHWQEGNRLTVRVFPCTAKENRRFKIGITSPLRYEGQQLHYDNVDFQGPHWKNANETIEILTEGHQQPIEASLSLERRGGRWIYDGRYQSDWSLQLEAPPLAKQTFSFNGQTYQLDTYRPEMEVFEAEDIYLDINQAWTKKEFLRIWKAAEGRNVYVHNTHGLMQSLTPRNYRSLFKELRSKNYSLFPFHKIIQPEQALVISKYSGLVPTLSDLEGSTFHESINAMSQAAHPPIRIYSLNGQWSDYLRCLREIQFLQPMQGDVDRLVATLQANRFLKPITDPDQVKIGEARMIISRFDGSQESYTAPDHLLRLFAYNNIMRQIGPDYFSGAYEQEELVNQAKEAYVVSPISSLVVLESQEDYDRFGIEESNNSLKNASIEGAGAVPEPEEWLMILLSLALALFLYRRLQQKRAIYGA